MKMWKKVTAIAVVLLLVLSTMSIGVSAEGETGTIGITITADKTTNLYPGDIVTFTINISTNFRAFAMRWPVMYTLKAFEPVVANDGNGDADYGNVIGLGTLEDTSSYLESGECPVNDPFGAQGELIVRAGETQTLDCQRFRYVALTVALYGAEHVVIRNASDNGVIGGVYVLAVAAVAHEVKPRLVNTAKAQH